MDKGLTEKQKRFCEEYIFDFNGTRAYKAVYKDVKKESSAMAAASRLLSNVKISEYIEEIQKDFRKQANISFLSQVARIEEIISTDETTTREKIDAIKEINKMFGFYAPEKKENKIISEQPLFPPLDDSDK